MNLFNAIREAGIFKRRVLEYAGRCCPPSWAYNVKLVDSGISFEVLGSWKEQAVLDRVDHINITLNTVYPFIIVERPDPNKLLFIFTPNRKG